ncbi:RNA helicase, partial [Planctomycetota bacterium]
PQDHMDIILEAPSFYTAIGVFLKQTAGRFPRPLMRLIGLTSRQCPPLIHTLLEELLGGLLYTHSKRFIVEPSLTHRLEKDLARLGAANQRRIELDNPRKVAARLVTSASKLASITAIAALEQQALGEDLRLVILTDYIRKDDLPRHDDDLQPIKRLGVVPIFEQLRRENIPNLRLGILSGSLVIIPQESLTTLHAIAGDMGVSTDNIKSKTLAFDIDYCEVQVRGADAHRLVQLLTELFNRGAVTTLVGTAALLGEGASRMISMWS